MDQIKNEILILTKELAESLSNQEPNTLEKLEELKEKVQKLNNEQVLKKFNVIEKSIINKEYETEKLIELIDNFNKYVEKNINLMEQAQEAERLEKEHQEKTHNSEPTLKIQETLNNFSTAIKEKNLEKISKCNFEFIDYLKSLKDENKVREISKILSPILAKIGDPNKNFKTYTDEEIEALLENVKELEKTILKIEEEKKKTPIPETLSAIRKEMEDILKISLFEGIEYENEHAIKYQLDDYEVDKFQELRKQLKDLLLDEKNNKEKIDEIRVEMFILLGIDPYTYGKNKDIIDSLTEPNKSRFEELKKKHDEILQDKLKEKNKNIPQDDNKITDPLPPENNPSKPDDDKTDDKGTDLVPVGPTSITPVPTPEPKKKKGRLVKAWESAKKFYKKHKKAILLVTGLVLLAVSIPTLLPAIMQFNSGLWWTFVNSGALPGVGFPKVLNDINLLIGSKIGATFAANTGIWTLANGAVLNAAAAQASILAALGKVALSAGTIGVGATLAVKNAYRLAKEKIQNRKNKKNKIKDNNENSIFKGVADSLKKGYEKGKGFAKDIFSKEDPKKTPSEDNGKEKVKPTPTKEKFYNENLSDRMNGVINYYFSEGLIKESELEELEKLPKEECIAKFKDIITNIESKKHTKSEPESKVDKSGAPFTRTDLDPMVTEFINYCINTGVYIQADIDNINNSKAEEVNKNILSDPRFYEYKKNFGTESKEEGKSK